MSNSSEAVINSKIQEVIDLINLEATRSLEEKPKEESEKSFKEEKVKEETELSQSSSEDSMETKGDELNMGKIEKTYSELTHQELQTIAYELGIAGIHSKPDTKLRKDIIEAHAVQKLYSDREDVELNGDSIFEEMESWRFAHELRSIGTSNDSIKILVENEIVTREALQRMTKEELREIGLKIGQAAIIANSYCAVQKVEKEIENRHANSDINEQMRIKETYNRLNKNRYPHNDRTFVEFLSSCEKELALIDKKKSIG